jgi:hypothetical protein
LEWYPLDGKKASRIKLSREGEISKTEAWEDYFGWFKNNSEIFQKVFYRYVRKVLKTL